MINNIMGHLIFLENYTKLKRTKKRTKSRIGLKK